MQTKLKLFILAFSLFPFFLNAQIKISDTGNTAPDANSILELESTTRGFLGPRVTLTDLSTVSPLTGTIPEGMLVYNSAGSLTHGYYVWTGSNWVLINTSSGNLNVVTKSTTQAVTKEETYVAASGNITLTLPAITASDNGLSIIVKNIGSHTDLVNVIGNGGDSIDGLTTSRITRWKTRTYVAYEGNWLIKEHDIETENIYEVGAYESWTTIPEIIEYLDAHMSAPSKIRLDGGSYDITTTLSINLPYALTIEGPSYGQATIGPASGITQGTPLFSLVSEVSFKMIAFDATTLSGYGTHSGENAINLITAEQYHEIKDCTFDRFYNSIYITNNVDVWLFESDLSNSVNAGVEVNAGSAKYVSFFTSESDFTDCTNAINLKSGDSATISVQNCTFTCSTGGTGLNYTPATFTHTVSLFFTNNTWNNVGTFVNKTTGFDFSRADGRDANVEIINNAGIGDQTPHCKINVKNNSRTKTITTGGTFYKGIWWGNGSSVYTINIDTTNNRLIYLPQNAKDMVIYITGNISVNATNHTLSVGVVKNDPGNDGVEASVQGEISVRTAAAGTPTPFSTVVYMQNVNHNDFFEIFVTSTTSSDVITLSDLNIYASAQ